MMQIVAKKLGLFRRNCIKTIPLREMRQQLSKDMEKTQKDEDIFYMTNRPFWKMLRRRRSQKTIPFSKAKGLLGIR